MYIQNHINTLLFGCESWTLTEANLRKLEVYHHKALDESLELICTRWKISTSEMSKFGTP